jgi:hypothetical protein
MMRLRILRAAGSHDALLAWLTADLPLRGRLEH